MGGGRREERLIHFLVVLLFAASGMGLDGVHGELGAGEPAERGGSGRWEFFCTGTGDPCEHIGVAVADVASDSVVAMIVVASTAAGGDCIGSVQNTQKA